MNKYFAMMLLALAGSAVADISMGESRRPVPAPTAEQSAAVEALKVQKTQLLNALQGVTDAQSATSAEGQIKQLAGAIVAMQQQLGGEDKMLRNAAEIYMRDSGAMQIEAALQREIARVSAVAGGKILEGTGLEQTLFRYIPEEGYDTSGAHDVDGNTRAPKRPERKAPPLRPMPVGV